MGNRDAEYKTFAAFLNAAPKFAGGPIARWIQPTADPPDILCTTDDGRGIGLELTEWLDQDQIGKAKGMEAIQDSILKAIRPEPPNNTEYIDHAWLSTLPRARVKPADAAAFRAELLKLVDDVDARWDGERGWHSPQGCWWRDFNRYPTLARYLSQVKFFPRSARGSSSTKGCQRWLTFPYRGGAYSEASMVDALLARLKNKIHKYPARPNCMDEFHLLVHYDQALAYNSPVETPTFRFKDAARKASSFIGNEPGVFDSIFLFLRHESPQRVFRLYPGAADLQ